LFGQKEINLACEPKIVKPIFGLHSVGPYSGYIVSRLEIILNVCRVANTGLMVHIFARSRTCLVVLDVWFCHGYEFVWVYSSLDVKNAWDAGN